MIGAGIAAGSVLVACNKGGDALSCDDTSGLDASQVSLRTTNGYVEQSPEPAKDCANCSLFTAGGAGACGGCTVIPGPINPEGYCNVWVAAA